MPIIGLLGDVVRVLDDMVQVHSLQTGHGEWNDDMALVNKFNNSSQQLHIHNVHVKTENIIKNDENALCQPMLRGS